MLHKLEFRWMLFDAAKFNFSLAENNRWQKSVKSDNSANILSGIALTSFIWAYLFRHVFSPKIKSYLILIELNGKWCPWISESWKKC